ncbi:acyltransferase family protein [Massilia sp. BJB1822]|uniref:acyltransferase family protein n=1 Tax=Massilia sp. BJB1822 TaxID=2744470 RepID=UPI001E359417|nr:acyltransferase family protein [Massilia sp. BJB1822]
MLLLAYGGLQGGAGYPGWRALLPVSGALLLLAAGPQAWINRRLLAARPLVWVGLISYPLYLWHWPLLAFSRIIDDLPNSERNLALVLSFLLAWLTWRYVEQPLRRGRPGWRLTGALAASLAALGLFSLFPPAQTGPGQQAMHSLLAANDFMPPYRGSCSAITQRPQDAEDWCHAGNAGAAAPDAVLLGDSMANSYTGMLLQHSAATRWRFRMLGRGQCPALLDYGPAYCREMVGLQQAYVAATPSIQTVLLAAHWSVYARGFDYARFAHQESATAFATAFRRTVEYYQGLGKKVVVLLPPPVGMRPRSCIPRPLHGNGKNTCQRDLRQAQDDEGAYREQLLPYLAQRQIGIFDPFPLLCNAQSCKLLDGQHILYLDWMHLSRHGSEYLATHGGPQLRQALGS